MIGHLLVTSSTLRECARRAGRSSCTLILLCLSSPIWLHLSAQSAQQSPNQAPASAPSTGQLLSSYEGQHVTAIEVVGRPESAPAQFASLLVQKAGQPFSKEKVDQTVALLKATGKFEELRVQVEAEANGVRVLLVLEPAVYFGIFQFPGAERFPYSRLVQVANYPNETPFNAAEVEHDRQDLITFFRQQGYFEDDVNPEVKVDSAQGLANLREGGAQQSVQDAPIIIPPSQRQLSICKLICRNKGGSVHKSSWPELNITRIRIAPTSTSKLLWAL